MKSKNIAYIILLLGSIMMSACSDYLNVKPANVRSVASYDDVKTLMGSHLKMYQDGRNYLSGTSIFFMDNRDYLITEFYSDNLNMDTYLDNWMGQNNKGDFYKSLDWKHTDIHESIWTTLYGNIGFYNMVLDELNKHQGATEAQTNMVRAEAKFLRAWSFFRLMQFYSPYHENKLGLPLNTNPEEVSTYDKSRKTQTENYSFITNELEEILNYNTNPSSTYNIFFDKHIIHALLAQVYLYKGDSGAKAGDDYSKALMHTEQAMEGRLKLDIIKRVPEKSASFGLDKTKDYALLSFLYNNNDRMGNIVGLPDWGLPQYASDELYQLYQENDKRKNLYFGDKKEIKKFETDFLYGFYQCDFFTAAEMQLIIAESQARMGKENEALQALNEFAQYRYEGAYTRPAGESILQTILNERRKEFCFEYCMRWMDLTRIQKGWTRKALDKKEGGTYTLTDGDYRFCMPIPKKAELQQNKIEQNPGWANF